MSKRLFDAHTHINDEHMTDEDRRELAEEIEASEVLGAVDPGSDLASSEQAVRDAAEFSWCYAAVGYHPSETDGLNEENLDKIRALAENSRKVVCIGEIGLDYHYDEDVDHDTMRYWFRRQIRLANELRLPIMIHTRDADQETMDILKEEGAFSSERQSWFPKRPGPDGKLYPDSRVLMHCFSQSVEMARQYLKLGATLSICGPVTFKNNRKTREVVRAVPIEFLTVETDAPYMAPEPKRGRRNKAPYVEYTCRKVAELKDIPYEEAAEITCRNALRFYDIDALNLQK
ncbi:MAG: TatD family hydrolase [Clostridiales bacterium]|jgi:TatD DNase family protein|nr:TatD family hydrolase [Clostridiales bacterium]